MEACILEEDLCLMRPLQIIDIARIRRYASAAEIAENTFVPHPYPAEAASEFVETARENWRLDESYVFAIMEKSTGAFVGVMGIHPKAAHNSAEVDYWIGKPFWGRGLASAALRLIIEFGFERLGLNRIEAGHFPHNPASGRVMQKANMRYEGRRRQAIFHREAYTDLLLYAILREDYQQDLAVE